MRRSMAAIAAALVAGSAGTAEATAGPRFEQRVLGQVDGFATDVAIARMNGDRRPDVVVAVDRGVVEPGGVQVAINRPRGFRIEPFVAGGQTPYRVGVGDLDGDRDVDVALPNTVSQDVTVLGNDGFGGLAVRATLPAAFLTRGIAVAEVDGDGLLDVVTSATGDPDGATSASLRVFPGGDEPAVTVPAADFFPPAETIAAVDVDRDRQRDLVAVDQSGVLVSHRTAGGFEPVRRVALVEDFPFDVAAGDLNGDGLTDLATANLLGTRVAVLLRSSDNAGFEPPRYVDVGAGSAQIAIAELDGDCRQDIVVTLLDAGKVAVLARGQGVPQLFDAGPAPLALEAADMDLDGDRDLVVGDRDSQELRLLVNRRR